VKVQLNYGHQQTLSTIRTLTITSQQIAQVFKAQGPLQLGNNVLSGWQGILLIVVLVIAAGCMLFVGYTLSRKVIVAIGRKK
jgi:hypothetical protein